MPKVSLNDSLPLIKEAFSRNQLVTIPLTGHSMEPILSSGDAVTLAPIDAAGIVRGDIVLYRRASGQFVLHRVVNVHKDTVDFCGDNQVAVEKHIPVTSLVAKVISYEKDGCTRDLKYLRKEGRRRLSTRVARRVLSATRRFRRKDHTNDKEALRYVLSYVKRHIPSIVLMCVLSVLVALSTLGMAMVSGIIIDKVLVENMPKNHFREWFYLLFLLLFVVATSNVLYSNIRVRVVERVKNEMREDLFASLLTKSFSSVQGIHSGDILNHFTADVQTVVDTACTIIPQALSIAAKLLGGILYMFLVEPMFTSMVVVLGIVLAICLRLCSRFYKSIHKECQVAEGHTRSFLQECIQNIMVIKSFDNEKGVLKSLDTFQQTHYKKQLRRNFFANIGNTAIYTGFTLAYYSGLAWGVLRMAGVIGTVMSYGTFAAFLQIMEQIRSPFRNASGIMPQFYSMLASAERLLDLKKLPKESRPKLPYSVSEIYEDLECLEIQSLDFSYDNIHHVFRDASCRFYKGRLTAIAGGSGIGKSTLIKILLGFVEPQNGTVSLRTHGDNIPISASTRPLFSYVPQGNMVLSGTLAQNLVFGRDGVTEEEIRHALDVACLSEVVARLPKGINTAIGERGIGLSEGQIQRLAIARALISKAPILLLDECTSALDAKTEKKLIDNLRSLGDRTLICISHKEAILDNADDIIEIHNKGFKRFLERDS